MIGFRNHLRISAEKSEWIVKLDVNCATSRYGCCSSQSFRNFKDLVKFITDNIFFLSTFDILR